MIRNKYEDQIVILPEDYMQVLNDLMEVDLIDEVLYVKSKDNACRDQKCNQIM